MVIGTVVNVHRNLSLGNNGEGFSVKDRNMRLVNHAHFVCMADVAFVVQDAGHSRAVDTGQRNVHAFARGTLLSQTFGTAPLVQPYLDDGFNPVGYNPFGDPWFYYKADPTIPLYTADEVVGIKGVVYAR